MTETYAKCTYSRQLETCYNSACEQIYELSMKLIAVDNDWTLSDKAKLVKIGELKDQIAAVKENACSKIYEYCDEYKKRLDIFIAGIGGKQMDKEDIFLLQSPIVMTQEEFTALAEKHKGNYWMMRALDDYCNKVNKAVDNEALKETENQFVVSNAKEYDLSKIKTLSMPYEVYSFDRKRQRADQAASGFVSFITQAEYDNLSKCVGSAAYGAYIAVDGYAKLEKICCE